MTAPLLQLTTRCGMRPRSRSQSSASPRAPRIHTGVPRREAMPRLGEDAYVFAPSLRHVRREDVPAFLAGLPSAAMLFPTTIRGVVALQLLNELSGDRAAGARKEFANQRGGLEELAGQLGLTADSPILLEFGDEAHVVSLAVLLLWSERFAVHVGWNIGRLEGDPRASARLNLFRSDGVKSRGWS